MKKIKFYDLKKLNSKYESEFIKDFKKINSNGKYILGSFVDKFEKKFLKFTGSRYCVAVGNCLDAIKLSFLSIKYLYNLKDNDEVMVPANTYIASVLGITSANLKPIFIEPDINNFNISVKDVVKNLSTKTKAILAVDLYGHPSDLIELNKIGKKKNLIIIEDAAQSLGAKIKKKKIGSIAEATCFSFFPGKNLGAFGDAGAITTNNRKIYEIVKSLRNYGEDSFKNFKDRKYKNSFKGVNSRMDEIQAAILLKKLKDFSKNQRIRNNIGKYYLKNIKNKKIKLPLIKKDIEHAWHLFVIKCKTRNKLRKYLARNKIETMIHYPIPPHKQKAFSEYNKKKFLVTERLYKELLSLPLSNTLNNSQVEYIVEKINKY